MKDYVNIVTIFQGWHVSTMDHNNQCKHFWEEIEETKKWYKIISEFRFAILN